LVTLNHVPLEELHATLEPMHVRTHAAGKSSQVAFVTPFRFCVGKYWYSVSVASGLM